MSLLNGGTWLLNDVRQIPKLKRDLISINQLTSMGHTTFTGDIWKVITRGALVIAMERSKIHYLIGKHDSIGID